MAARRPRKAPSTGKPGKQDLPKDVNAAIRARRALELVIQGHSYSEVAELAGYSGRSAAWTAVHRELKRSMQEPTDKLRQLEVMRLDRYLAIADAKAAKGDLWAIDRCLKIAEARRALLGLNQAPVQVSVASGAPNTYILGIPDDHPTDAPLPAMAMPDGIPQPGPGDVVLAIPQSVVDAI